MGMAHRGSRGCGVSAGVIENLVCRYLRWRYGGDRNALKPPLGYPPRRYRRTPFTRKLSYAISLSLWRVECALFNRYGGPMRRRWLADARGASGEFYVLDVEEVRGKPGGT